MGPRSLPPLVGVNLVNEAVLLRSPLMIGEDGIDPLKDLPLSALTASHRLNRIASEGIGADTIENSRAGMTSFTGIVTDIGEVVAVERRGEGLAPLKIACGYDPDSITARRLRAAACFLTVISRGRGGARAGSRWMPPPRLLCRDHGGPLAQWQPVSTWSGRSRSGASWVGIWVAGHADGLALLTEREDLAHIRRG